MRREQLLLKPQSIELQLQLLLALRLLVRKRLLTQLGFFYLKFKRLLLLFTVLSCNRLRFLVELRSVNQAGT